MCTCICAFVRVADQPTIARWQRFIFQASIDRSSYPSALLDGFPTTAAVNTTVPTVSLSLIHLTNPINPKHYPLSWLVHSGRTLLTVRILAARWHVRVMVDHVIMNVIIKSVPLVVWSINRPLTECDEKWTGGFCTLSNVLPSLLSPFCCCCCHRYRCACTCPLLSLVTDSLCTGLTLDRIGSFSADV